MEPTVSVINRVDNILLTNEKPSNSDNLSDKDIFINIPSVPSTNKNLLTHEISSNNKDSQKLRVSTPASKDDSPLFKEHSLSERNSSTMNISEGIDLKNKNLVLKNTLSTINVSSLTETQIFELNANKNHSNSEKSSLDNEECSKSNFPSTLSKMRSFSTVNDSSRNQVSSKIESRIQRSHSIEESIFLRYTDMPYLEKEDCKKQLETKNKNFLKPCSTILVEKHSLDDKLSSMSKSSQSTEDIQFTNPLFCDELSSRSILSKNTSPTLETIVTNKDDSLKSIDKSDLKLALPIKINLCALNKNSERISDIESTNIVAIQNNTKIKETLISTEVDLQETVLGKKKRKLEESTMNVKKQNRRSSAKRKCLKSVFRELFGDEDDEDKEVKNSSSVFDQKRRKVDSRDSCDSGTCFSEAFPNSVTTFTKDVDLSEIFSPDSTGAEPKAASLKSLEKCKVTKLNAESPQCKISISISDDLTKTIVSSCPTNQKERPVLDKESPEVNEVIQGEENRVLPDTTCVSEDELAVVEKSKDSTEQVPKILSETEIEKETMNDKTTLQCQASLNNLSDDLLSKAGIIKDVKQNSYVFSSDEINSLLNMLVGGIENNENKSSENEPYLKPGKKSKETNLNNSTDLANKPNFQEDNQKKTESSDSDVEIIMEKGYSMPLISDSTPNTGKSTEKILPPIENTLPLSEKTFPSTPRLRVKDPSELGCPRWFSTLLNVSNPTDVSLPPQQILSSNTQTSTTFLMNNAYTENMSPSGTLLRTILSSEPFLSNLNNGQNTMPNRISKVALSAAEKLISLICPLTVPNAVPQISQYYSKLMNMLAEISKDTVTLRQFYKNRALGLCSRDLLGFNLSLNKKLRSLSTFLQIAFEEKTLLSIFKNYHILTSGPILNPEELNYIMSLQYFDVQPNTNRINPCDQRLPFPMNNIAFMHPSSSPIQLSLPSPSIGQILMPGYLVRTFRPESFSTVQNYTHNPSINNGKGYNLFTHEQLILLKSQIRDYNILHQRMRKLLHNQKILVSEQSRTAVKKQSTAQVTTASQVNSVQQQKKQSHHEIISNDMRSSENTTQDLLNSAQNRTILFRNKSAASSVVIAQAAVSQANINVSSTITNKKPSKCDSSLPFPTEETVIIKSTPKELVRTSIITRGTTSSVSNTSTSAFNESTTVTTNSISLNSTQISSVSKTSNSVPIQTNAATSNETECDITNQNTNLLIRNRLPIQQKIGNISTVRTRNIPIKKAKSLRSSVIYTISTDDSIKASTSAIKNRVTNESNRNHVSESDKRKITNQYKSMPSLNSPPDSERKEDGPTNVSTPDTMENNRRDSQSSEKSVSNISQSNDEEDFDEEYLCLQCNEKSTVACGRCEKAYYCSKTCQEKHWETIHHESCQPKKEV